MEKIVNKNGEISKIGIIHLYAYWVFYRIVRLSKNKDLDQLQWSAKAFIVTIYLYSLSIVFSIIFAKLNFQISKIYFMLLLVIPWWVLFTIFDKYVSKNFHKYSIVFENFPSTKKVFLDSATIVFYILISALIILTSDWTP